MKPKTNAGYSALPLLFLILSWVFALPGHGFGADPPAENTGRSVRYVGSESCVGCHLEEYDSFTKKSKKAHSYQKLIPLKDKLTAAEFAECCA
ncbi:MAG TPA: hypothetical protein ENN66_11220 [Proteobacteria bacterium]|nr:hypothetical protein [Pseudomonadota bacterium]